jgi:deoxyribodipyrimidine photo-lyase
MGSAAHLRIMPAATLLWFKRDLRTADHAPLASVRGPVVPLFIAEPEIWGQGDASARQWRFVAECLVDLRDRLGRLGTPLIVRRGEAVAVLAALRAEQPFDRIASHEETGLRVSWDRDRRVAAWCAANGVRWDEHPSGGVVRRLASRDGWAERRERVMRAPLAKTPARLEGTSLDPGAIPDARDLGLSFDPCPHRQKGGRVAAETLLRTFLHERGEGYSRAMSSPLTAETACSRLSPHLAWGTLSLREAHRAASERAAEARGTPWGRTAAAFRSRLAWHDHFTQKLEDFPDLDRRTMHPAFDGLHDRATGRACLSERLGRWAEGRTGLPFVDACMRYARATGWLNFRMRAMVQAVASYHLWLDFRDSAPVLARLWTDYVPGIHWAQAQMQSGTTGINQLRIYNPVKQGLDQDPTGAFTRAWLPEIAHLPDAVLQEPWRASVAPRVYPAPLVDVIEAARAARARMTAVRRSDGFHIEAERVVVRHGSRKGPSDRAPRRPGFDPRQAELPL